MKLNYILILAFMLVAASNGQYIMRRNVLQNGEILSASVVAEGCHKLSGEDKYFECKDEKVLRYKGCEGNKTLEDEDDCGGQCRCVEELPEGYILATIYENATRENGEWNCTDPILLKLMIKPDICFDPLDVNTRDEENKIIKAGFKENGDVWIDIYENDKCEGKPVHTLSVNEEKCDNYREGFITVTRSEFSSSTVLNMSMVMIALAIVITL